MRAGYRNSRCRISELSLAGMPLVVLQNELLRVSVLAGKGADIIEFLYKPLDLDFMWASPLGVRNPGREFPAAETARAFAPLYEGGWQELFPHASRAVEAFGAQLPFHGEVWSLSWDYEILEDAPECVAVRFSVRTRLTPFKLSRTMRLRSGKSILEMEEEVNNEGREALSFIWGHHPAFGESFLTSKTRLFAPASTCRLGQEHISTWPLARPGGRETDLSRITSFKNPYGDMLYLWDLSAGWYALTDPERKLSFALAWEQKVFPYIWVWRCLEGGRNYPWYGRARAMAVEPVSSLPFAREESGRLLTLAGGKSLKVRLAAAAVHGLKEVTRVSLAGELRGK